MLHCKLCSVQMIEFKIFEGQYLCLKCHKEMYVNYCQKCKEAHDVLIIRNGRYYCQSCIISLNCEECGSQDSLSEKMCYPGLIKTLCSFCVEGRKKCFECFKVFRDPENKGCNYSDGFKTNWRCNKCINDRESNVRKKHNRRHRSYLPYIADDYNHSGYEREKKPQICNVEFVELDGD